MRFAAAGAGILAGVIELAVAVLLWMAEGGVKTQVLGNFSAAVSIVVPLIMIAGAAMFLLGKPAWFAAGVLVVAWAVQRLLLPLSLRLMAPAALIAIAVVLAMIADGAERRSEDRPA